MLVGSPVDAFTGVLPTTVGVVVSMAPSLGPASFSPAFPPTSSEQPATTKGRNTAKCNDRYIGISGEWQLAGGRKAYLRLGSTMISTRRLDERPSTVLFVVSGLLRPRPSALTRS